MIMHDRDCINQKCHSDRRQSNSLVGEFIAIWQTRNYYIKLLLDFIAKLTFAKHFSFIWKLIWFQSEWIHLQFSMPIYNRRHNSSFESIRLSLSINPTDKYQSKKPQTNINNLIIFESFSFPLSTSSPSNIVRQFSKISVFISFQFALNDPIYDFIGFDVRKGASGKTRAKQINRLFTAQYNAQQ